MAKGVQLITAIGEFVVTETIEDILERKNKAGETGDLNYTVANTKEDNHTGYKASCIGGLYRAVREVEMPEKKDKK